MVDVEDDGSGSASKCNEASLFHEGEWELGVERE